MKKSASPVLEYPCRYCQNDATVPCPVCGLPGNAKNLKIYREGLLIAQLRDGKPIKVTVE